MFQRKRKRKRQLTYCTFEYRLDDLVYISRSFNDGYGYRELSDYYTALALQQSLQESSDYACYRTYQHFTGDLVFKFERV